MLASSQVHGSILARLMRHKLFPSGSATYATTENIVRHVSPVFSHEHQPFSKQLYDKIATVQADRLKESIASSSNVVSEAAPPLQ